MITNKKKFIIYIFIQNIVKYIIFTLRTLLNYMIKQRLKIYNSSS